ncbi:MAG: acyl--CoA ligase, partial [Clostridia bacterium]|nr:acyl--CoA ligase [Clostridia bacterium]
MTRNQKYASLKEDMTFRNLFELAVSTPEETNAVWLSGDEIHSTDCGYLKDRSLACAEKIRTLSFGETGHFVGLAMDTCREWAQIFWGIMASGRKALLIDPSLADSAVLHLLTQAGATALIARKERELPSSIAQAPPELLLYGDKPSDGFTPEWADHIALCTSGTTATSRVYLFNGKSICSLLLGLLDAQKKYYITRESNGPMPTLCFLPSNHIFGFIGNIIWMFILGYPQVYLQDRTAETILRTCRLARVRIVLAVPLLVNNLSATLKKRIAKEPRSRRALLAVLSAVSLCIQRAAPNRGAAVSRKIFHSVNENLFGDSLEMMILGGSSVPKEHLRRINALGYSTLLGFGMTEVGVTSVEVSTSVKSRLTGSVGWPLSNSEYKVKPNGRDKNIGELFIRTGAIHIGRMENGIQVAPDTDADGWYATGDIVRIGRHGRMYVKGRTKDVIIGESGENVYPDELENHFADLEGVEQLCALATRQPTSPNDIATLVLYVGDKFRNEEYLASLAEIIAQRNTQLNPIRRIQRVLVTSEKLPVVNAIKVKRNALQELIHTEGIPLRTLNAKGAATARVSEPSPEQSHSVGEIRDAIRRIYATVLEM